MFHPETAANRELLPVNQLSLNLHRDPEDNVYWKGSQREIKSDNLLKTGTAWRRLLRAVKVVKQYLLETWKGFPQLQLTLLRATGPLYVSDTLSVRLSLAKRSDEEQRCWWRSC